MNQTLLGSHVGIYNFLKPPAPFWSLYRFRVTLYTFPHRWRKRTEQRTDKCQESGRHWATNVRGAKKPSHQINKILMQSFKTIKFNAKKSMMKKISILNKERSVSLIFFSFLRLQ